MTQRPNVQRPPHPAPSYRLRIGNLDITPTVDARLISLTLTECRGNEADQLDLVLSDHDGALEMPSAGRELQLAIGWSGTDLVDKGTFVVDEVEHSGAPDQITIRARSADLGQALRVRVERSFHDVTLGEVLQQAAIRHGLIARVAPALGGRRIEHIDQTNESDLNFVTRLAKLHDAVATIKHGRLLFLAIDNTRISTGESLPVIEIMRTDGDKHRYHSSYRDAYTGVEAFWHDAGQAQQKSVFAGLPANAKRLKENFANAADARNGAQAEWNRILRGAATLEVYLALGLPILTPQTATKTLGWNSVIDANEWLTTRVRHTIESGIGFTTHAEFEIATKSLNQPKMTKPNKRSSTHTRQQI